MFYPGSLFMEWNVYVPEGGNERGRDATPTSISIFDSYDMKTLWFKSGHDIFSGCKMPRLWSWNARFLAILWNEIEDLKV